MNEITFVVNTKPRGKERARTFIQKGRLVTTTPEKTRSYEKMVTREYKSQCKGIFFTGELELIVNTYHAIPKSWSKKKKQAALNGEIRPIIKPDISNVIKSIEDALNGVAYKDDSAIVDIHGHKYYAEEPRVEVTIIGDWVRV